MMERWEKVFGEHLHEEIIVVDEEGTYRRYVTPMQGLCVDNESVPSHLRQSGPAASYFQFLQHANGVNYFGVYLSSAENCQLFEPLPVVKRLPCYFVSGMIMADGLRWIVLVPEAAAGFDKAGFYLQGDDGAHNLYALDVTELLAKLRDDIGDGTFWGTQTPTPLLSPPPEGIFRRLVRAICG
jgi:hypothetical protein